MTSKTTMTDRSEALDSTRSARSAQRRGGLLATLGLAFLTTVAAAGCLGNPDDAEPVTGSESALARGSGSAGQSYSCSGGTCTCDKSIENDCEDMSGVCSDGSIDNLIACINGWLTTHCTCTQALVAPPKPKFPTKGVVIGTATLKAAQ